MIIYKLSLRKSLWCQKSLGAVVCKVPIRLWPEEATFFESWAFRPRLYLTFEPEEKKILLYLLSPPWSVGMR